VTLTVLVALLLYWIEYSSVEELEKAVLDYRIDVAKSGKAQLDAITNRGGVKTTSRLIVVSDEKKMRVMYTEKDENSGNYVTTFHSAFDGRRIFEPRGLFSVDNGAKPFLFVSKASVYPDIRKQLHLFHLVDIGQSTASIGQYYLRPLNGMLLVPGTTNSSMSKYIESGQEFYRITKDISSEKHVVLNVAANKGPSLTSIEIEVRQPIGIFGSIIKTDLDSVNGTWFPKTIEVKHSKDGNEVLTESVRISKLEFGPRDNTEFEIKGLALPVGTEVQNYDSNPIVYCIWDGEECTDREIFLRPVKKTSNYWGTIVLTLVGVTLIVMILRLSRKVS
jgi:hypothetical protein